jgi:hypothetical protein
VSICLKYIVDPYLDKLSVSDYYKAINDLEQTNLDFFFFLLINLG